MKTKEEYPPTISTRDPKDKAQDATGPSEFESPSGSC